MGSTWEEMRYPLALLNFLPFLPKWLARSLLVCKLKKMNKYLMNKSTNRWTNLLVIMLTLFVVLGIMNPQNELCSLEEKGQGQGSSCTLCPSCLHTSDQTGRTVRTGGSTQGISFSQGAQDHSVICLWLLRAWSLTEKTINAHIEQLYESYKSISNQP